MPSLHPRCARSLRNPHWCFCDALGNVGTLDHFLQSASQVQPAPQPSKLGELEDYSHFRDEATEALRVGRLIPHLLGRRSLEAPELLMADPALWLRTAWRWGWCVLPGLAQTGSRSGASASRSLTCGRHVVGQGPSSEPSEQRPRAGRAHAPSLTQICLILMPATVHSLLPVTASVGSQNSQIGRAHV